MGRTQLRLGVWALALLTCFAVVGDHTAFAADGQRLEAAGWYFGFNPNKADDFSPEIKFGVTGKDDHGNKLGRFEYFDTFNGLKVHGKLTYLEFHPNYCASNNPFDPPLTGPAVTVHGQCDNDGDGGSPCSFQMDLVDGGDPGKGKDLVCNVMVQGFGKHHTSMSDSDMETNTLTRGNIKIRDH